MNKINKKLIDLVLNAERSPRKTMMLAFLAQKTNYHVFGSTVFYHYNSIKLNENQKKICEYVLCNYDLIEFLNNGLPERRIIQLLGNDYNHFDNFIYNSIKENL